MIYFSKLNKYPNDHDNFFKSNETSIELKMSNLCLERIVYFSIFSHTKISIKLIGFFSVDINKKETDLKNRSLNNLWPKHLRIH